MALDWAGHYELLENILLYLMVGIPEVAFVTKSNPDEEVLKFLVSEAELEKIPYTKYTSIEDCNNSSLFHYHTLFVFFPMYTESEVSDFWNNVKKNLRYVRLFHYRHINDMPTNDLILVNFSQSRQIDMQKKAVETWLKSKYEEKFWENSFWKSFDVILALIILEVNIKPYIVGIFRDIADHYKNGSYDGVLAPTCGLLELLNLICTNADYKSKLEGADTKKEETINWLITKYHNTSNYNKKFIIRAFHRASLMDRLKNSFSTDEKFLQELHNVATTDKTAIKDKFEIDLCLDIETCLIYNVYSGTDEQLIKKRIKDCVKVILDDQKQNGRWDNNLGKTARILFFLIEHEKKIKSVDMSKHIELGINALRKSYNYDNWENKIVTTAISISALVLSDQRAKYESKDFLSQISHEVKLTSAYSSLKLALETLSSVLESYNESQIEIKSLKRIKKLHERSKVVLYTFANVATISILLLISYYIFLWLEDRKLFIKMLSTSLMWIPIAVGIAITAIVGLLPNVIKKIFKKKNRRKILCLINS